MKKAEFKKLTKSHGARFRFFCSSQKKFVLAARNSSGRSARAPGAPSLRDQGAPTQTLRYNRDSFSALRRSTGRGLVAQFQQVGRIARVGSFLQWATSTHHVLVAAGTIATIPGYSKKVCLPIPTMSRMAFTRGQTLPVDCEELPTVDRRQT